MKIRTTIHATTGVLPTQLVVGKWATVYVAYSFTAGGYGLSRAYINGQDTGLVVDISNAPSNSVFSTADFIRTGGFIGHLKRIKIFSPASFGMSTGTSINSFFLIFCYKF